MAPFYMAGFEEATVITFQEAALPLLVRPSPGRELAIIMLRCGSWSTSNMLIAALLTTIAQGYFRIKYSHLWNGC